MAGNPLIDQGYLNRLRASVTWTSYPSLNVTASYLGKDMIGLALQGEATTFINTSTGTVQSPEPYQPIELTIHLLKSQGLSAAYKAKQEVLSSLGSGIVRPDVSSGLTPYSLNNCAIRSVNALVFNGTDAGYVVTIGGYYIINSSLWNT